MPSPPANRALGEFDISRPPSKTQKREPYRKLEIEHLGSQKPELDPAAPCLLDHCNNLLAASSRHNLVFTAAYHIINVYRPVRLQQNFCGPPWKVITAGHDAHPYNDFIAAIAVGELGSEEVLCAVQNNGNVRLWSTENLERPIFQTNVGDSAWGIAMHKETRRLAISDNSHKVTVFEMALRNDEQTFRESFVNEWEEMLVDEVEAYIITDDDIPHVGVGMDKWGVPSKIKASGNVAERHFHGWRTVFANQKQILKGHSHNIPSLSFLPDRSGRWLASAGIDECFKIWDLQAGCEAAVHKVQARNWGWSVSFIDPREFMEVNSIQEALGCFEHDKPESNYLSGHSTVYYNNETVASSRCYNLNTLELENRSLTFSYIPYPNPVLPNLNQLQQLLAGDSYSTTVSESDYMPEPGDAQEEDVGEEGTGQEGVGEDVAAGDGVEEDGAGEESAGEEGAEEEGAGANDGDTNMIDEGDNEEHSMDEASEEDYVEGDLNEADYSGSEYVSEEITEDMEDEDTGDEVDPSWEATLDVYMDSIMSGEGIPDTPTSSNSLLFPENFDASHDTSFSAPSLVNPSSSGGEDNDEEVDEDGDAQLQTPATPTYGAQWMAFPDGSPAINLTLPLPNGESFILNYELPEHLPQSSPGGSVLDVAGTPLALPPPTPTIPNLDEESDSEESYISDDRSEVSDASSYASWKRERSTPATPPASAILCGSVHRAILLTSPHFDASVCFSPVSRYRTQEKMHLVARIPELNLVLLGCLSGTVYAFRLTRFEKRMIFRVDHVLPRPEERIGGQTTKLVGLTVSPMQGQEDYVPEAAVKRKTRQSTWRAADPRRRWRIFMLYSSGTLLSYEVGRKNDGSDSEYCDF